MYNISKFCIINNLFIFYRSLRCDKMEKRWMMFFLCYVYFLYYKLICCILIMIGYFVYKKYLFEFFRFVKWVYVIINLFVSIVKIKNLVLSI